jgi:hypothetical protein
MGMSGPALLHMDAVAVAKTPCLMRDYLGEDGGLGVDVRAYCTAVSEQFSSAPDAFAHYLRAGRSAEPELFPFLDPKHYQKQLAEPIPEDVTPFEHYVIEGAAHDISPMPLFDPKYVRSQEENLPFRNIFDYLADRRYAALDPALFEEMLLCSQYRRCDRGR